MIDGRPHPRLRHATLPALIFLFVTLVAVGAAIALHRSAEARDRARFEAESRVASVAVAERMERQVALLRGAAGLFAAAPEPKSLWIVDGAEHVDLHAYAPAEYERRIGGFLVLHLAGQALARP